MSKTHLARTLSLAAVFVFAVQASAGDAPLPAGMSGQGTLLTGTYAHASGLFGVAPELTRVRIQTARQICPAYHMPFSLVGDPDKDGQWTENAYYTADRSASYSETVSINTVGDMCTFQQRTLRLARIATYDGKRTRIVEFDRDSGKGTVSYVQGKRLYTGMRAEQPIDNLSMLKDTGSRDTVAGYPCRVMRTVNWPIDSTVCVIERGNLPPYIPDLFLRNETTMPGQPGKGTAQVDQLSIGIDIDRAVFAVPSGLNLREERAP